MLRIQAISMVNSSEYLGNKAAMLGNVRANVVNFVAEFGNLPVVLGNKAALLEDVAAN